MDVRKRIVEAVAWEPWWAEFWSGSTTVLWAAFSYAAVGQWQHLPMLHLLAPPADERLWELLGLALGFGQMAVLACNRQSLRSAMALMQGWFWAILTVGLWDAAPWSPAVAVHAGWCVVNLCSGIRMLRYGGFGHTRTDP